MGQGVSGHINDNILKSIRPCSLERSDANLDNRQTIGSDISGHIYENLLKRLSSAISTRGYKMLDTIA